MQNNKEIVCMRIIPVVKSQIMIIPFKKRQGNCKQKQVVEDRKGRLANMTKFPTPNNQNEIHKPG
jgi:hypothetical protein